ncbi:MAG: hypothetical protein CMJ34_04355 [Phycisphaerae bacterium]|nr:hypothetical protein [Phycisphaerae bacterium]
MEPPLEDDITAILEAWRFDPERVNVRFIEAVDGRPLIQVRVEMGLLQMNRDGRPDGGRDELEALEAEIIADEGFRIDAERAAALRAEAVLIHQRYVALLSLEAYELVVRDATRNLRIFDLCRDRGVDPEDRGLLEQFRAQVVATRSRAAALGVLREGRVGEARRLLDAAVEEIRAGLAPEAVEPPEIPMLEGMRDILQPRLPASQRHELERRLHAALAAENYELAAILRDELRQLP